MFARTYSELQSTATSTNSTSGLTRPSLPHVDIILSSKRPAEKAKKKVEQKPRVHIIWFLEMSCRKYRTKKQARKGSLQDSVWEESLSLLETMITSGACS